VAPADAAKPTFVPTAETSSYTVVARRYRPQRFEDVVGQDHVVQALRNAITHNRVTHAYLFSGTRGVGKTSIARIFAKCLNCVHGPTDEPCLECDICQAIAVGQDVDVIEIDGASNNGVESVRELRQNAGLRPSRARFKIYYIDEVHMLSTGAFNALLKTLEEPPEHVKFFFATTEPTKIPITVLSRCQRYDFAGIAPEEIVETLARICEREQVAAEPEALSILARRARGSLRDAQSLLEQLLSSAGDRLTAESVYHLLGTASDERLLEMLEALADRSPKAVLKLLNQAANESVQPVDVLDGLIDFVRDAMVLAAGADTTLLAVTARQRPRLQAVVDRWPLDSITAALQILAETRSRLRGSPLGRILVEVALVRVASLEDLTELSTLIGRLAVLESSSGGSATSSGAVGEKKKSPRDESALSRPPTPGGPAALPSTEAEPPDSRGDYPPVSLEEIVAAWPKVAEKVGFRLGHGLTQVLPSAILGPNVLVIPVGARYNWIAEDCGTPEAVAQIEQVLRRLFHRPMKIRFERSAEEPTPSPSSTPVSQSRREDLASDPLAQKVEELFEARVVHLEAEDDSSQSLGP
jgi:DNA polymerase-3 subunit gamma/tau